MSVKSTFVCGFVTFMIILVGPLRAQAQDTTGMRADIEAQAESASADTLPWYITPYVGAFLINDDELGGVGMELDSSVVIFGARIGYRFDPNWSVEGSYGYSPLTATADSARVAGTAPLQEVDGSLHVYGATFNFMAPSEGRARVILSAGGGGMYYTYDPFTRRHPDNEIAELVDDSWANEFDLILGAGFEVDAGERVAFRFDARDHVQFCRAEEQPIDRTEDFSHCPLDDAVLSNFEFSGGLTIRF